MENLLPYNIEYRIYDKNTDQNWKSYLRKGGIMPIHSVELNHFILLNVAIQDSGEPFYEIYVTFSADGSPVFKPSDFAIINTDGHSDFDIEKQVVLRDQNNRKLSLGLNFVYVRSLLLASILMLSQEISGIRGSLQGPNLQPVRRHQ